MIDPLDHIDALRPQLEGNPQGLLRLAGMMKQARRFDDMVQLCETLLDCDDPHVVRGAWTLIQGRVPAWHVAILNDRPRIDAYFAAISEALRRKPGARVLEIGTGSGILAMHAARAGASVVNTCEGNRTVAKVAREVIAANGFDDRVKLFERHSTTLTQQDIGGPADILVSEILADNVVGEDVLPSHEHAMSKLCGPDTLVIPARAAVRVALASYDTTRHKPIGLVDGFDLSATNRLKTLVASLDAATLELNLLSKPLDLFDFDLARATRLPPERRLVSLTSRGGLVHGVVQWLWIDLIDGVQFENRPRGAWSSWGLRLHRFDEPIDTQPGEIIEIDAAHNRKSMTITRA